MVSQQALSLGGPFSSTYNGPGGCDSLNNNCGGESGIVTLVAVGTVGVAYGTYKLLEWLFGNGDGDPDPKAIKKAEDLNRSVKADFNDFYDNSNDRKILNDELQEAVKLKRESGNKARLLGSELINHPMTLNLDQLAKDFPDSPIMMPPLSLNQTNPDLTFHDSNDFQTQGGTSEWEKLSSIQRYRRFAAQIREQDDVEAKNQSYIEMAGLAIHAADVSYAAGNLTRGDTILETSASLIDSAISYWKDKLTKTNGTTIQNDPPLTKPDSQSISPSSLLPGDMILSKSNGWTGDRIANVAGPHFSHVSMYVGDGKIVEAIPLKGVVVRSLQDAIGDTELAIAYRHNHMTPLQAFAATLFAASHEGDNYDYIGAATSPSELLCGIGFSSAKFCSELVTAAINDVGSDLSGKSPSCTTPGDIFLATHTGNTKYVGHIIADKSLNHDLSVVTQPSFTIEHLNNVSLLPLESLFSNPECIPES